MWSIGAGLLQPLFHGGELEHKRRAAVAAYDQAAAQYRQTVLLAFQQRRRRAARARGRRAHAEGAGRRRGCSPRDTLDLTQRQFQLGAVNYLALLDAQRQYQQARLGAGAGAGGALRRHRRAVPGAGRRLVEPATRPRRRARSRRARTSAGRYSNTPSGEVCHEEAHDHHAGARRRAARRHRRLQLFKGYMMQKYMAAAPSPAGDGQRQPGRATRNGSRSSAPSARCAPCAASTSPPRSPGSCGRSISSRATRSRPARCWRSSTPMPTSPSCTRCRPPPTWRRPSTSATRRSSRAGGRARRRSTPTPADLKSKRAQVAQQAALVAQEDDPRAVRRQARHQHRQPRAVPQPGDKLVTLQAIDPIYVDFTCRSSELPQRRGRAGGHADQPTPIRTDAFDGQVTAINPKVDPARATSRSRRRCPTQAQLLPGMFVTVTIDTGQPSSAT